MSISNSQYDAIMREYEELRRKSHYEAEAHKEEVYKRIPEYKEIEQKIADIAMESAAKYFDGDKQAILDMRSQMDALSKKKEELLAAAGYPKDYLLEKHQCQECQDTGYIEGNKCKCLRQKILKVLYKQSNVQEMLERENFSTLTYDYYDDADLDMMKAIIEDCKRYVDDFTNKYENIMLLGNVGVGKTFLTNCIAKELIDCGNSVIYFTSIRLFDTLSKCVFTKSFDDDEDDEDMQNDLYSCDLLIIDDLGTENVNSFVASRLFDILNERDIRRKSTIISTNLPLESIAERYSERNFSRIFGNYKVINPDISDIRIKKRRQVGL